MTTWKEIFEAIPNNPFGSGKDEQALTDAFEDFVGGPSKTFELMRLYTKSQVVAGKNYFKNDPKDHIDLKEHFMSRAKEAGFTQEEAEAYLDYHDYV